MNRTTVALIAMMSLTLATAALAEEPSSNAPPAEHKAHGMRVNISTEDEEAVPKEVADKLNISEGTVKIHLHHIYEKLGLDGRLALSLYARDRGLL